jgi:hypothetical protein
MSGVHDRACHGRCKIQIRRRDQSVPLSFELFLRYIVMMRRDEVVPLLIKRQTMSQAGTAAVRDVS